MSHMSEDPSVLNDEALDQLFRTARTFSAWQKKDVSDVLIRALYDLTKYGPTSANCSPARFVFVRSPESKARLKPHLMPGNVDKTMSAPLTVIIAQDMTFYEHLPRLFPYTDARSWFEGKHQMIYQTAFRNSSLQAGYMIMAARALGLDCGPMSGFDSEGVKSDFFAEREIQVNMLCNIGYGDPGSLHPRGYRFDFEDVCEVI